MPPNPPDVSPSALLSALAAEYAAAREQQDARIVGLAETIDAALASAAVAERRLDEHDAVLTKRGQSEADLYRLVDALGTSVVAHTGGIERLDGLAQEALEAKPGHDLDHVLTEASFVNVRKDVAALRDDGKAIATRLDEYTGHIAGVLNALQQRAGEADTRGDLLTRKVNALYADQATLTTRLNALAAAPVATPDDVAKLRQEVITALNSQRSDHATLAGWARDLGAAHQTFVKSLDTVAHDGQDTDSRVSDAFAALEALRAAVQMLPTTQERAASDAVLAAMGLRLDRLSDELATAGASGSLVTAAGKGYMMHTGHEHTPRLYLVSTFAQNGARVRVYKCRECAFQEAYELPVEGSASLEIRGE